MYASLMELVIIKIIFFQVFFSIIQKTTCHLACLHCHYTVTCSVSTYITQSMHTLILFKGEKAKHEKSSSNLFENDNFLKSATGVEPKI